ncbi:hypothetical protein LSH36_381g01037 [Paralvinella palmiformis]|uniref:Uncharacterized protein n=1 Tax=Paralvinella palmiformis TaxID=53620 RepID=A0AAD9N0W5_9ANNE|nr:hypothetical protein LSH36_381g01037 [Paralvinella palmiformis]
MSTKMLLTSGFNHHLPEFRSEE